MKASELFLILSAGVIVTTILTTVARVGLAEWREGRKGSALFGWALSLAILLAVVSLVFVGLGR